MRNLFTAIFLLVLLVSFASCTSNQSKATNNKVELTFVASTSGVHDNGYMQAIHSAFQRWAANHKDIKTVVVEPTKFGEGDQAYLDWKKSSANNKKSMIVMGGSEYLNLVLNQSADLKSNQHVLIIESNEELQFPKGVSSFYIKRKGASYLMGCLAKHYDSPLVIAALEKEAILQSYIQAFAQGVKDASGKTPQVQYLSEGYDGFQMPEKAKEIASQNPNTFIYPLNGLSIKGIFDTLNESSESDKLVSVGLDMNCNNMSDRIVASMVVNFDKVFDRVLGAWENDSEIPVYFQGGLKDGYVDIQLNDSCRTVNGVSANDYRKIKEEYMDEALQYEAD